MRDPKINVKIKLSALRGRGGAGFPTGQKWRIASRAEMSDKIVICNADEGDPGAFMDRSAIEGDPHTGRILGSLIRRPLNVNDDTLRMDITHHFKQ